MNNEIIIFMKSIYDYREDFNFYVWGSIFLFILTSKLLVKVPMIGENTQYVLLIISFLLFILLVLRSILIYYKMKTLKLLINQLLKDLDLYDLYY